MRTAFEYKHGGKTPIAKLAGICSDPIGCSTRSDDWEPCSNNLRHWLFWGGSVFIFAHAKGTPKGLHRFRNTALLNFAATIPKGNLYVDGTQIRPEADTI